MTLQGWYRSLEPDARAFAIRYLGNPYTPEGEVQLGLYPPRTGKCGKAGGDPGSGLSGTWELGPDK
ncbi:MAG: hypothetical protein ACLUD2_08290 [Clostridium sp.]